MMKYIVILIALLGVGKLVWDFGFAPNEGGTSQVAVAQMIVPQLSAIETAGKAIFDVNCASCHGVNAQGVENTGPTLIHKIYEPNHHADMSFYLAAKNGVRAHHWPFGNMPKQPQVNTEDIVKIVAYIRKLQQANGIF